MLRFNEFASHMPQKTLSDIIDSIRKKSEEKLKSDIEEILVPISLEIEDIFREAKDSGISIQSNFNTDDGRRIGSNLQFILKDGTEESIFESIAEAIERIETALEITPYAMYLKFANKTENIHPMVDIMNPITKYADPNSFLEWAKDILKENKAKTAYISIIW